jgi:hypothetical protein
VAACTGSTPRPASVRLLLTASDSASAALAPIPASNRLASAAAALALTPLSALVVSPAHLRARSPALPRQQPRGSAFA